MVIWIFLELAELPTVIAHIHNFRTRFRTSCSERRIKTFQCGRKSFKQKDLYCSGVLFQARNYLLSNKLYDGNIILAVNEWSFSGYFRQIGTYNLHLRKHVHKQNRMAGTALLALAFRSYWKLPIFNFSNSIPVNWADMEILPNLLSWKIREKRLKDIKEINKWNTESTQDFFYFF